MVPPNLTHTNNEETPNNDDDVFPRILGNDLREEVVQPGCACDILVEQRQQLQVLLDHVIVG